MDLEELEGGDLQQLLSVLNLAYDMPLDADDRRPAYASSPRASRRLDSEWQIMGSARFDTSDGSSRESAFNRMKQWLASRVRRPRFSLTKPSIQTVEFTRDFEPRADSPGLTRWETKVSPSETVEDTGNSTAEVPEVESSDVILGKLLGRGAQAAVYAGNLRSTGLPVAVKVFRPIWESETQVAREVAVASKVRHPNVLRVFGHHRAGVYWVVVMEMLGGQDLGAASLTTNQILDLSQPIRDGLRAMAEARVVHRDIKPANIVLRKDGSPVIADFGVAVDLDTLEERPQCSGSPLFMPTEAFTDAWPEPSWDIYAFGMTMLTLLAKDAIPTFGSARDVMFEKSSGQFEARIAPALSALPTRRLRHACRKLLASPETRLRAIEEFPPTPANRFTRIWESVAGIRE